eukprot:24206-Chlamydomonas_euryale.AAC.1
MACVSSWGKPTHTCCKCKLASGSHAWQIVLLPRIRINLTESKKRPIRKSHPVNPFAMTVNESQGQTFSKRLACTYCALLFAWAILCCNVSSGEPWWNKFGLQIWKSCMFVSLGKSRLCCMHEKPVLTFTLFVKPVCRVIPAHNMLDSTYCLGLSRLPWPRPALGLGHACT